MRKWEHPGLLLLLGSVLGGLVTAIYLTDLFGFHLVSVLLPESIDSGWGSLVGAFISGVFAFAVFWVQRICDQKDARKKQIKNVLWCLDVLNTKVVLVLDAFSPARTRNALQVWELHEGYEYIARNYEEADLASRASRVISERVLENIRDASISLSASEVIWAESDAANRLLWLRETIQVFAKAFEKFFQNIEESCTGDYGVEDFVDRVSTNIGYVLRQRDRLILFQKMIDDIRSEFDDLI
ncbi:hypothetical protein SAMN02744133_105214 [Thalassospira xiamenensis M-5 = DSM 17429]|uniref:Uncharacterized protein n=1 Tax=Thalassospira xiamenensis M-5 = DSM 17429 TaxID=1123366 RepID=A0AB72UHE1_9PROT|nr:hypothetical protein [Thalassospira xiamenensis]AJD53589.1 hypothetical protein TH3_17435 [Thalassospira xiamenensis M-5 = DSM 17429]SIT09454.1 hypothetical protein SAMN02744133_105214 [Thalassospira xiamenensis M-5 = DSM 17429]